MRPNTILLTVRGKGLRRADPGVVSVSEELLPKRTVSSMEYPRLMMRTIAGVYIAVTTSVTLEKILVAVIKEP